MWAVSKNRITERSPHLARQHSIPSGTHEQLGLSRLIGLISCCTPPSLPSVLRVTVRHFFVTNPDCLCFFLGKVRVCRLMSHLPLNFLTETLRNIVNLNVKFLLSSAGYVMNKVLSYSIPTSPKSVTMDWRFEKVCRFVRGKRTRSRFTQ